MKREWKPGDVALHPDYGLSVVTERCGRHSLALGPHWHHAVGSWNSLNDPLSCGKYRPLVVIDPEDREQVERLGYLYYAGINGQRVEGSLFDEFQRALREFANPKPPKPEEPTGLGAVVEDAAGHLWTRGRALANHWTRDDGHFDNHAGPWFKYAEIDAVRVLSEGVQA